MPHAKDLKNAKQDPPLVPKYVNAAEKLTIAHATVVRSRQIIQHRLESVWEEKFTRWLKKVILGEMMNFTVDIMYKIIAKQQIKQKQLLERGIVTQRNQTAVENFRHAQDINSAEVMAKLAQLAVNAE